MPSCRLRNRCDLCMWVRGQSMRADGPHYIALTEPGVSPGTAMPLTLDQDGRYMPTSYAREMVRIERSTMALVESHGQTLSRSLEAFLSSTSRPI